ncbi:Cilia- and flagella-associated protein [Schistosoma japonicum]|nr:Cilia- and flagella-associated protein [Schistosoma japonicum]
MSVTLQEYLQLYCEDKQTEHIVKAFSLLNFASNTWKPGRNFPYTSYEVLQLALASAEAHMSVTVSSIINIFESVFGTNNEFSDLISLLSAEVLFQQSEYSESNIELAMSQIERLLIETYVQVGSRKEASQLLDTLAGSVARFVPEQMVELIATASGANLTSAERYINWVLGVYSSSETENSTGQSIKSFTSQAKEGNLQMSGPLAQSLISFGIVPASRFAKLRASTKNPSEQIEEFLKIFRLLEIQDENNELVTDKQIENKISTIGDSPVDDTNNSSNLIETMNSSEENIDDALSSKVLTTETRFKLLRSLIQLALDRDLLHICTKCIKQCENMIKKEKLSIHYQAIQRCHNLLEQCLSSSIYQSETIIQGCLTLWRLCSPLIQHNLQSRLKTYKSLQLVITHLTKQDSLYYRLRCEVHMMVAYCQADMEQITEALENIDKAIKFDETGEFSVHLNYFKKCLLLRSNLYEIPIETIEQARQIIEHLQNTNNLTSNDITKLLQHINHFHNDDNNSENINNETEECEMNNFTYMLRILLIHISKLIDKSIFEEVYKLETIQHGTTKLLLKYKHKSHKDLLFQLSSYKQLWLQINNTIKHHSQVISENAEYEINEKLLVWFDLIKLAKKYQLWDLCSTMCRLCLVLDDDVYWTSKIDIQSSLNKSKSNPRSINNNPDLVTSFELKLYNALSQINCIFAECLCILLRQQMCGIQLAGNINNINPSWFDTSLLVNNAGDTNEGNSRKIEEQNEHNLQWKNYCEWFGFVNESALFAFQRSAVLSARIADSNNLHSSAVCLWNYCLPTICQSDHRQLTTTFSVILENANKIGSSCLPLQLYIEMATVLAHGLIQPWLPNKVKSTAFSINEKTKSVQPITQQKSQKVNRGKSAKSSFYIVPVEGQPFIKKAIDWLILAGKLCEPNRLDLLQDIDQSYQVQPIVSITTRSRLIVCWLSAKQLIANPPICRGLFPLDVSTESANYTESNFTSDSDSQTRKLVLTNQKEAQFYLESLITRTLLAVHSLWLTNRHKYISEWPAIVLKLIDEQSVQTSLEPAIHLMQLTFCNRKSDVHNEHYIDKLNIIKEQEININYNLRMNQSPNERFTELELWTRLAMIAFLSSQFSTILDIIDMSNIQMELYHNIEQLNVNNNYWLIHLLCLRGLAVFGLSNQIKLFHQQNLKTSGKYTQQQQQTRGKQRLTEINFKYVELLGRKRDKSTTSEDSQSIENSLFEAGEEAFYKASDISYKIERYDLLVMSIALYWTLLKHPILAPSNQIIHVLQKIQSFAEKIENLTKWLSQCIKIEVRNELAAQIRNNENKQEYFIVKLESILMDSINSTKEVSSLYETVVIPYPTVNQFEMDLQLRVDMYEALYSVYSVQFLELNLLTKMSPDIKSLFRQLVVTKARLRQSIEVDMQKFTSEPEYLQAQIWIEIAYASRDINVQMMAFKQSIDAIKNLDYWVLKSDLLLEFAQWLFAHGYDTSICISLAEEALDILSDLNKKHYNLSQCKESKYGQLLINSRNVQYLDILMRACILLAEFVDASNFNVHQVNCINSLEYLIIAVNCVKNILNLSVSSVVESPRVDQKSPKSPQSTTVKMRSKSNVPSSTETYRGRQNLVTMACLDRLLDLITEMGPGQLGYPILILQDSLVRSWARYDKSSSLVNCSCIGKLIHLKSMELSCCLGSPSGVTNHQNKLNPLLPNEQEVADAYTLLKTNPTDPYLRDLIKSWIHLGDRLAKIGQCSHARIFLSMSKQFIIQSDNDQMKYWLLVRARLALVEGQYKLTRSLISKIFHIAIDSIIKHEIGLLMSWDYLKLFKANQKQYLVMTQLAKDFEIEDESFWFDCLSVRIDALCYDPNLTIQNSFEINDNQQSTMNDASYCRHFGIQTAINEIDLAINDLQKRKINWKSRDGWFNKFHGLLLSKKAQLISRIDEMNYHYSTLFNSLEKPTTCDLPSRPINLLINLNSAPQLFEEVIRLLNFNKRAALRLGWIPLLAYWVRGLKYDVNLQITKLRTKSYHPSTLCSSFEVALTTARQCLNFAEVTVKLMESFSTVDELKGCSLPVHRDLIEVKFMLIAILHNMMKLHVMYMRIKLQESTLKDPLYCAVENYIAENSSDSFIETLNKCDHSKQIWDHSILSAFDEKTYNSVMDLFSQASSLFIICLKICFGQNYIGLARQVTQSLLNLLGGCHERIAAVTQDLLIGFQSCSTAVRLRTHFWLTLLAFDARKCSGSTQCNLDVENDYTDRSISSAPEALVRQLLWSSPTCAYDDDSFFSILGFCSITEPSSYPEALAWMTGLKSNLISNRLRSIGGLCDGSEDHDISTSPWITFIVQTLTSQSQAWRTTEINPSVIFDSAKILQSTLSSLPGSNSQTIKNWNLLIMEHSVESDSLYVAIPKCMNRIMSNRNQRNSIPTNKSANKGSSQYTFMRLQTDPMTRCRLIYSWKKCLNHLDDHLKKAVNIKSNNWNLLNETTDKLNYSNDGLMIITDFWLNELPLESLIMNKLLNNLCSNNNNNLSIKRYSSIVQNIQTRTTSNSIKQNNSPHLKPINTILPFSWLTREFSVQLLYSRLIGHQNTQKTDDLPNNNREQSGQHKTSKKPDTTRGNSRHPLLRNVGLKLPPLQSCKQQNSSCLLINTTFVRYLVDPFMDTEITTSNTLSNNPDQINRNNQNDVSTKLDLQNTKLMISNTSFKDYFQLLLKEPISRSQQFTSRWIGLMGDSEVNKVPSKEELLIFLHEGASGLISYIPENFLSYLPPSTLINLSIPITKLFYFVVYITISIDSSPEHQQRIIECELEQPLSMAIISSLIGTRSTIMLQWSTQVNDNQFRLEKLIKYLLDQVYPIGQSILLVQYEHFKNELDNYMNCFKQINEDCQLLKTRSFNDIDSVENHDVQLQIPILEPFNMIVYGLPNISFA